MHDEKYMLRCLQLAALGLGHVSPNPLVGAVLVHEDKIIGEGWHMQFGGPHAEVNAFTDAMKRGNESLISQATLYVNLEPCSHHGKTPPCTNLILEKGIQKVVVGMPDPFDRVNGEGMARLRAAGVVVTEVLGDACRQLNRRFVTFHQKKRPYIIIKFAQSRDHYIAPEVRGKEIHRISGMASHRLVHKWRSEEDAVLVGYNTARADNPRLTVRQWSGRHPVRIVVDMDLSLPQDLHLFNGEAPTLVFNGLKNEKGNAVEYIRMDAGEMPAQICTALYERKIQSVILEGGLRLIQEFVNERCWDEARIFTAPRPLGGGIPSPFLSGLLVASEKIEEDELCVYSQSHEFNGYE